MTQPFISVVTGGSSGIGAACVRHLSQRGDTVILLDLPGTWDEAKLQKLGAHAGYACDVTDEQAVREVAVMIEKSTARFLAWSTVPGSSSINCPPIN